MYDAVLITNIVKNIKYVDKVIQSKPEDCDVYDTEKYDFLFVGSDYKGTERFNRYEEYFENKDWYTPLYDSKKFDSNVKNI